MRGGWALFGAGLVCVVIGGVMVWTDWFSTGFGISIIGVFAIGAGAALIAEPWHDSVDAEIDRWERNWTSTWSPECPVHGLNLCVTRTRRCPSTRDRIPV